jgi:phospholipase/carboxylesterase
MESKSLSLYHLIRPSKLESKPAKVLFLMHGYGSDEHDLFSFAPELPNDLFLISVRAPYTLQPYGYAWYGINFEAERGKWSNIEQAEVSRDRMMAFIDEAIDAYNLNPNGVSLLGFSQGTILGYAMALSYPERFKMLIALSGYIDHKMLVPDYLTKQHNRLSIFASHGREDIVIPLDWAEQSSKFLTEMKINHCFETFPVGHGVSGENLNSFKRWMAGKY